MKIDNFKIEKEKKATIQNNIFLKIYFILTLLVFFVASIFFFNTGYWEKNKKLFLEKIFTNGVFNYYYYPEIIYYKFSSLFTYQNKIFLEIKQKDIIKIESNRKEINDLIKNNYSNFKNLAPFIKANVEISVNRNKIFGSIRLKGDRQIHFEDKKNSSYRIDLRSKNYFNGMKKFSIQKPRIRNYLHEWIFHELLKEEKLVTINYDFYDLFINGNKMGYYVLEEGFGKTLLERNNRRNGPIFSLFEEIKVDEDKFEVYNKKYWESEKNVHITQSAIFKLKKYLKGNLDFDDVFDSKKWAWFFAVSDLNYMNHGFLTKSVRFYYNPVNGKFEPIGFDGHRFLPNYSEYNKNISNGDFNKTSFDLAKEIVEQPQFQQHLKEKKKGSFGDTIVDNFFYSSKKLNKKFFEDYIEATKKISEVSFLNNFFNNRSDKIKKITSGIYSDSYIFDYNTRRKSGIGIYYFNKSEIFRRAKQLKNLSSVNLSSIFIEEENDKIKINNYSHLNFQLINGNFVCKKKNIAIKNLQLDFGEIYIDKIKDDSCNKISFFDKSNKTKHIISINKYNSLKPSNEIIKNYNQFFEEKNNGILVLKQNVVFINKNIFIPKGYNIKIFGNQKIYLIDGAFIVSASPWYVGDNYNKAFIGGVDNNYGGGIVIYDTIFPSSFKNCEIKNLLGLNNKKNIINNFYSERIISGSINFFQTKIFLDSINVENIKSEDAINIISSDFEAQNLKFKNIFSDAIDVDFGNGIFKNLYFENIGNDAIDFSGSISTILNADINNAKDKAISAGEMSRINISNLKAKNTKMGVASKDGSITNIENAEFNNVFYPIATYQKKQQFFPGEVKFKKLTINDSKINFIRDAKSKIFNLENNKFLGYEVDIKNKILN